MKSHHYLSIITLAFVAIALRCFFSPLAQAQPVPPPARGCPSLGWTENLSNFLAPSWPFPTNDTAPKPGGVPDCAFHQWSWEAFVWATALDAYGVPRFITLPTPEEFQSSAANAGKPRPRQLKLASRSLMAHATPGFTEGAGAIVEADGNILIAPNGYPVYASVHMNQSYFDTAKKNLIATGGYTNQPGNSYFNMGDAVFKATWLRLDAGQQPPAGAYTTQAQVPILTQTKIITATNVTITILPAPGQSTNVTVALVGLHVVGYTVNHPEFLWGTFEHKLNAPSVPDGTFTTNQSNPNNFTFYKANTSFALVNVANIPPQLTFNPATQRFSPINNVAQQNQTGGDDQTDGPGNILALNTQAQGFLAKLKPPQSVFANYDLVGTVWMFPNTYTNASATINAVGSVSLANTTAETFVQGQGVNCFTCHNQYSYSPTRRIAISHALAAGSDLAVPNLISGTFTNQSSGRSVNSKLRSNR